MLQLLLLFFAVVPAIFAVAAVVDVTAAVVAAAAAVVVAAAATDISKTESFFFHPNLLLLSLSFREKVVPRSLDIGFKFSKGILKVGERGSSDQIASSTKS